MPRIRSISFCWILWNLFNAGVVFHNITPGLLIHLIEAWRRLQIQEHARQRTRHGCSCGSCAGYQFRTSAGWCIFRPTQIRFWVFTYGKSAILHIWPSTGFYSCCVAWRSELQKGGDVAYRQYNFTHLYSPSHAGVQPKLFILDLQNSSPLSLSCNLTHIFFVFAIFAMLS